jgi:hypothetical protein
MPIKKNKFRKASDAVKKTPVKQATNAQLERLFKVIHIKYVRSLEDQLVEDKAHLYCKESTISTLQREIQYFRNKMRKIEVFEDKRARLLADNETAWGHKLKEYIDANKDLAEQNKKLAADHIEITRAYNSLHNFGIIAKEQGIDIGKHRAKLPENNKWDFKPTQLILESGKVIDRISRTKRKKK